MPFEIPQKTEQENRVALGRIALEAIAAHILTVPPEYFNLRAWQVSCGTVGCAIGHGCSLPEVQATGLKLGRTGAGSLWPVCGGNTNWEAVQDALGIDFPVARHLFDMYAYDSADHTPAHEVSRRIRTYLARTV